MVYLSFWSMVQHSGVWHNIPFESRHSLYLSFPSFIKKVNIWMNIFLEITFQTCLHWFKSCIELAAVQTSARSFVTSALWLSASKWWHSFQDGSKIYSKTWQREVAHIPEGRHKPMSVSLRKSFQLRWYLLEAECVWNLSRMLWPTNPSVRHAPKNSIIRSNKVYKLGPKNPKSIINLYV